MTGLALDFIYMEQAIVSLGQPNLYRERTLIFFAGSSWVDIIPQSRQCHICGWIRRGGSVWGYFICHYCCPLITPKPHDDATIYKPNLKLLINAKLYASRSLGVLTYFRIIKMSCRHQRHTICNICLLLKIYCYEYQINDMIIPICSKCSEKTKKTEYMLLSNLTIVRKLPILRELAVVIAVKYIELLTSFRI